MLDHLQNRYGGPTTALARVPANRDDPDSGIHAAIWRSRSTVDDMVTTLEIRRPDDSGSADTRARFGAILLYRAYQQGDQAKTGQAGPLP